MKKLTISLLAISLLASACSGDGDAESTAAPSDPVAYCSALETMLVSQPGGGFIGDEFGVAMTEYSAAVRAAAELAPADQREALEDLALFISDSAADPTAEGLAERAFGLVVPMIQVQNHAIDECGLDVEDVIGGSSEPPPPIRSDISEIDVDILAAVNSLIPGGVELAFESVITTDDEEYPVLAAAPVGWEASDFIGTSFDPTEEFGFFTKMDVGAHCDGICAPRNWGGLMDDAVFGPFSDLADATEILRDQALTGPVGRLVVYRKDTTITPVEIVVTRWDDRADRYFRCEVGLDEADVDLWEAFAAACEAAIPLWIPAE